MGIGWKPSDNWTYKDLAIFDAVCWRYQANQYKKELEKAQTKLRINPDPTKFKILTHYQYGSFLLIAIHYDGCINMGGDKYLIFHDLTVDELMNMKKIDPHFQDGKYSPIIRIKPTHKGWEMGKKLCQILGQLT